MRTRSDLSNRHGVDGRCWINRMHWAHCSLFIVHCSLTTDLLTTPLDPAIAQADDAMAVGGVGLGVSDLNDGGALAV